LAICQSFSTVQGLLNVVLGQRRPAQINPRGDGTFDIVYYPDAEGPVKVDVQYGGKPVRDRY